MFRPPAADGPTANPEAIAEAQLAREALYNCGTSGHPACRCKGAGTTIRYLLPRQVILVRAEGAINFFPAPSPKTFILCDPEDRSKCVDKPDQNLHVGLMMLVQNVSDRTQNITCEID